MAEKFFNKAKELGNNNSLVPLYETRLTLPPSEKEVAQAILNRQARLTADKQRKLALRNLNNLKTWDGRTEKDETNLKRIFAEHKEHKIFDFNTNKKPSATNTITRHKTTTKPSPLRKEKTTTLPTLALTSTPSRPRTEISKPNSTQPHTVFPSISK